MDSVPHKTCIRCGQSKPLDLFKKRKTASDGRLGICKACINAAERIRSTAKYAADTEYRERIKASARVRMAAKYVPHPKPSLADRPEKCCPACDRMLPREAFARNRANGDGLHDTCKECRNAARRERRRTDPEWRERTQAGQSRRYHERYKVRERQKHARRYISDPNYRERTKEHARKAYRRNPGPYIKRARERQRQIRILGSHTQQEWETLCAFYGHRCLRCGEQQPLTRDHVIPLSKGGDNTIHNIQPLCDYCNKSKQDKTADYRTLCQGRLPGMS